MSNLILADFRTKTWHKPNESLEQMANVIFAECFPPSDVRWEDDPTTPGWILIKRIPRVAPDFSEKEGA